MKKFLKIFFIFMLIGIGFPVGMKIVDKINGNDLPAPTGTVETEVFKGEIIDGKKYISEVKEQELKQLIIPSNIDGYTVTGIKASVFKDNLNIESVSFPDTLENIEKNAFSGCSNLKNIKLPGSVVKIGDCAFADCYPGANIEIPLSVKKIGDYAFRGFDRVILEAGSEVNTLSAPWGANEIYIKTGE